jgi:hypothetical protein
MTLILMMTSGWNRTGAFPLAPQKTIMKKNSIFLIILIVGMISPVSGSVLAQSQVEVIRQSVEYSFGEEIIFEIEFESPQAVDEITLAIQAPGVPTFVGAVNLVGEGGGEFVYDLSVRPLPAFTTVIYEYQFIYGDGEVVESPEYQFTYLDNRFNWQELIDDPFKIYWFEGEITLAQEVLDAAHQGRTESLEMLQQPADSQPIVIFIYSSEEELQSSLATVGQSWVSGYADPARGSIVVALPSAISQPLEIQRLIPHEVAHILLYRYMGAEYDYLPTWLSEGFASQMEIYSLPEYDLALERAYSDRSLIPFLHLCHAFPADQELALLAYAQSDAFIEYVQQEYGLPGLQSLIYAYDQGVSCERGVELALGTSLQALDKQWQRDTFSRGMYLPFIYLLGGLLLVLILGLGGFIYYKMRGSVTGDEWDENETL